jgi:hypothetical protein
MIYRQHFEITIGTGLQDHPHLPVNPGRHRWVLDLLRSCKQIYFEAYHLFYLYNMLEFSSTANLHSFLLGIGHARRQQIRQIHVHWGWKHNGLAKEAFRILRTCGRLSVVYLTLTDKSNYPALPASAVALRGVRGLKSIIVERQFFNPLSRFRFKTSRTVVESPSSLVRYSTRPRLLKYLPREEDEINHFPQKSLRVLRSDPQILSGN